MFHFKILVRLHFVPVGNFKYFPTNKIYVTSRKKCWSANVRRFSFVAQPIKVEDACVKIVTVKHETGEE